VGGTHRIDLLGLPLNASRQAARQSFHKYGPPRGNAGSSARRSSPLIPDFTAEYRVPQGLWTCPTCGRSFRRAEQTHGCGRGTRAALLRGKAPALIKLFGSIERDLGKWGPQDTLYRPRYALLRTTRGFADLAFMRDSLRLALYLDRAVEATCFFKVGQTSTNRVIHVAILRTDSDWRKVRAYLKQAYELTLREDKSRQEGA
jgi:hypothetical protein